MAEQKVDSEGKDFLTDQQENMEEEIPSDKPDQAGLRASLEKSLPSFLLEDMRSKTDSEKLENAEENCKRRKDFAKQSLEAVDKKYEELLCDFKGKLEEMKEIEIKKLKSVIETCESTSKELQELKTTIAGAANQQPKEQSLIESKLVQFADNLKTIPNKIAAFGFEIVDAADDPDTEVKETIYHIRRTRPYLIKTLKVNLPGQYECSISSIALLGDDLMLVVDSPNYYLKLINTRTNTIVSSKQIMDSAMPWTLCVTDSGQVFVSILGHDEMLQLRYPKTNVSHYDKIPLERQAYGIHYHRGTLKMQCYKPSKVLQTGMTGKVVRVIHEDITKEKNKDGKQFIQAPFWSCKNIKNNGNVITSCKVMGSISEIMDDITPPHVYCWVHDQDTLRSPAGLVMDDDGSLLVCSIQRGMIFQVRMTGEIRPHTEVYQDAFFKTYSVAIDRQRRHLYVGGNHTEVLVYQM